jgi:glucose 1-dehydrogenase
MGILNDKVAIVTGGSSGIGKAIALALAAEGAAVMLTYNSNPDGANAAKAEAEKAGGRAATLACDVAQVADIQKLVDATVSTFGRLDIMINNAGMETGTSVLDSTEEDFDKVIAINLKGAFFGTQIAAKQMIAQGGGGRIINITSTHEDWPMPGNTPYCCSKGGVRMLTRTAGVELAPHQITVVGIAPGAIATPINRETWEDPEQRRKLEDSIPLGRIGEPEEVGKLAVWLASDQSAYVTATTYVIDGGIMQNSVGL